MVNANNHPKIKPNQPYQNYNHRGNVNYYTDTVENNYAYAVDDVHNSQPQTNLPTAYFSVDTNLGKGLVNDQIIGNGDGDLNNGKVQVNSNQRSRLVIQRPDTRPTFLFILYYYVNYVSQKCLSLHKPLHNVDLKNDVVFIYFDLVYLIKYPYEEIIILLINVSRVVTVYIDIIVEISSINSLIKMVRHIYFLFSCFLN